MLITFICTGLWLSLAVFALRYSLSVYLNLDKDDC